MGMLWSSLCALREDADMLTKALDGPKHRDNRAAHWAAAEESDRGRD